MLMLLLCRHGSREHLTALQGRMDSIEALMSQYGAKVPEPPKDTSEVITLRSPSATPVDCAQPANGAEYVEMEKDGAVNPTEDAIDMTYQGTNIGDGASEDINCNNLGMPADSNDSQAHSELQHDFHISPPQDASLSERRLADPEGQAPSLDTDCSPGQVRYYGPTTQLHIQSHSDRSTSISTGNDILSTSDFIVDMDGPQLREILMNSCWSYYSRSVRVVDPQLFMTHRATGKRSQYYSRFLEEALLACATRISTSQAVRKLGRAYADRAKQDVVHELEQPTIATLQGFLLLSDFEATSARDRVGWTYSGIACRLIFDLGLHEDCSQLVKHGILVQSDGNLRDTLFLAAFVYDRLWALYLGRPSCVPLALVQQRQDAFQVLSDDQSTLPYWVSLCKYISEVTEILNGFGAALDRTAGSRLLELGARISTAHDLLPRRLSSKHISDLDVNAYGLNMQFCGIQIVLHRAVVKILSQDDNGDSTANSVCIEQSRAIMYDSAACICRLTLAYREIFGLENFITVMLDNMYIAASTLISQILQPPASRNVEVSFSDAPQLLSIIAETVAALHNHYPVAEKMSRTLSRITENTALASYFGSCTGMNFTSQAMDKPILGSFLPPIGGSWGSMEALVHDDFILSQNNLFGDDPHPNVGETDAPWISDMGLGLIS
ncbi:fungal specific transcription factor [Ilyonectria robusta]